MQDPGTALECIRTASQLTEAITGAQNVNATSLHWAAPQEHVFSACAIALLFAVENSNLEKASDIQEELKNLLPKLQEFIERGHAHIRKVLFTWPKLKDSKSLPFVSRSAIVSICHSIERLTATHVLPPSETSALVKELRYLLDDPSEPEKIVPDPHLSRELYDAKEALKEYGGRSGQMGEKEGSSSSSAEPHTQRVIDVVNEVSQHHRPQRFNPSDCERSFQLPKEGGIPEIEES